MQVQSTTSRSDCETFLAANDDLAKKQDAGWTKLSTVRIQVPELKADHKSLLAFPFDLAAAVRDRDCYKVLLQSSAAQVWELPYGYSNIVSSAQGRQASIRDGVGLLLKEFQHSFSRKASSLTGAEDCLCLCQGSTIVVFIAELLLFNFFFL